MDSITVGHVSFCLAVRTGALFGSDETASLTALPLSSYVFQVTRSESIESRKFTKLST